MKNVLIGLGIAAAIWGLVNFYMGIVGLASASDKRDNVAHLDCCPPFSRFNTYVMPGYKFGCWLGQPVPEKGGKP